MRGDIPESKGGLPEMSARTVLVQKVVVSEPAARAEQRYPAGHDKRLAHLHILFLRLEVQLPAAVADFSSSRRDDQDQGLERSTELCCVSFRCVICIECSEP